MSPDFATGDVVYENPLAQESDVADFVREGQPIVTFPAGTLRLENGMDPKEGQAANYLFWCPEVFPADVAVSWDFRPIREPGLAMFWIAASGKDGKDLFDPSLAPRAGQYRQYHSGDINAYHLSYFRRSNPENERTFHTCNLRKSYGFHLITQGADPIPSVIDIKSSYHIEVVKCSGWIWLKINDLPIFEWHDDGREYGPVLEGGRIGFRQMAPLVADYSNLTVRKVSMADAG